MRIVIAGDGEVGFHLARQLSGGDHDIVVVDPHKELLKLIESHTDIMTIAGDSTSIKVLERAEIQKADLLISVLHDEKTNIVTSILGKKLGAKHCIARINNIEYLSAENKVFFNNLGIDEMVCPERLAADEIIRLLSQSAATEIFDFSDGKLLLFLIKLGENALVIDKTLDQIAEEYKNLEFRAVAIHRNGETIIPRGHDAFKVNDLAYVITKPNGITDLLKLGGKTKVSIDSIMIIGGGRIGRKLARELEKTMSVKLIEQDRERCNLLSESLNNTLIINGDARDFELLSEEGISNMDAFISVTDDSETNIFTCLLAKKYGVKRIISLIENIDYIDISQNIGIDTIINKKLITASYITRFTMSAQVTSSKCLSGIDAEVLEFVAKKKSDITKSQICNLKMPAGAIIGGFVRDSEAFIATGRMQIAEGDRVVVFAMPEAIRKVDRLFR
jgi:trk system potassium uptake protein TrkA